MIRKALSGQWSVERFQKEYYWYFLDSVPVQEKMEWTVETPAEEERQFNGYEPNLNFTILLRRESSR